jgi:hypothetical protein
MDDTIVRDTRNHADSLLSRVLKALTAVEEPVLLRPVDGWPLWKQFYHLLYWLDHWFTDPLSFVPPAFHEEHFLKPDAPSPVVPTKQQLLEYLGGIRERIDRYLAGATVLELAREQTVRGKIRTRYDMILGQFSHVNHHIGYLCATYRAETGGSIWKAVPK